MRVIAGKFKGLRLLSPKTKSIRPTADRVKEAFFRSLHDRIIKANFIDLCAGTGSIGIEALSRGAKHVTFVDRSGEAISLIRSNLKLCKLTSDDEQISILKMPMERAIAFLKNRKSKFDLFYVDPPYKSTLHHLSVLQISNAKLLDKSGLLCVEHSKTTLENSIGQLELAKRKSYGTTKLAFYRQIDNDSIF